MIQDRNVKKEIVGFYLLDGTRDGVSITSIRKPNIIRRFLLWSLGFKWISKKNYKNEN